MEKPYLYYSLTINARAGPDCSRMAACCCERHESEKLFWHKRPAGRVGPLCYEPRFVFTRFLIDNYRCFVNFQFTPQRINLLLGANGSGKSTFLKLVSDILDVIVRGADVAPVFHTSTLTRWDKREQQRIEFDLQSEIGMFHYLVVASNERIVEERVTLSEIVLFEYTDGQVILHKNDGRAGTAFDFRGTRSFLSEIERRPETKNLMVFLDTLDAIVSLRVDPRKAALHLSEQEQRRLKVDGANYASWYRYLTQESPEILAPLWQSLKQIIPGFQSMKLASAAGTDKELIIVVSTAGATYEVAYHELSDGQRCLIILDTLVYALPKKGLLFLDEPEIHVALAEVQPWLVELDERIGTSGQTFLASNHPMVVDYMAASTPYLFERRESGPVIVKRPDFSTDTGLSAAQQIQRGFLE